jgi:prephenate dehydrogenase
VRIDEMNVTVVGLGLLGGSIAYALRRAGAAKVWAVDLNSDSLLYAEAAHAVDKGYDEPAEPLSRSDLVFLCVPTEALVPFIRDNAAHFKRGALLTDTSGVRRGLNEGVRAVLRPDLRFVGGHPMAGKEDQGFRNADADIFRGASYLLTPDAATARSDVDEVAAIARALGCERVKETDEETHDEMIAYTSHLPHVAAAAMVLNPLIERSRGFAGGSFRDATRVARINPDMWAHLFLSDAEHLLPAIENFEDGIARIKRAILEKDEPGLRDILREARLLNETKLIPKP